MERRFFRLVRNFYGVDMCIFSEIKQVKNITVKSYNHTTDLNLQNFVRTECLLYKFKIIYVQLATLFAQIIHLLLPYFGELALGTSTLKRMRRMLVHNSLFLD